MSIFTNVAELRATMRYRESTEWSVLTTSHGRYEVVIVVGPLNMPTATKLRKTLYALFAEPKVAIDISGVTCCNFSGLTVLVDTLRHLHASGGPPLLVGMRSSLLRLFHAVGLTPALHDLDGVCRCQNERECPAARKAGVC